MRGKLKGFDQHLNLVLEETEDITNAVKVRKLGAIILRGDNARYYRARGVSADS